MRRQNEQRLIHLINHVGRAYRRAVNRELAMHGLSDAQALPVLFIARLGDGVRQGVLADQIGVEGPSLIRQLVPLRAAGLIETRDDPTDRRAKALYLTESGHALAETIEEVIQKFRRSVLADISDDALAACVDALHHVDESLQSLSVATPRFEVGPRDDLA